ncbi:hypothetical protein POTOM_009026 [Populus tomentosa]|uniref:UBA domain-containing protein n=1 Tax=Populus tomentosa TaxID=118781 RepID=A0A8X8DCY9_POPTO|nr:hypothetical protein POTOM_009026 [Populus tomentosa]
MESLQELNVLEANQRLLKELEDMGFPRIQAAKALHCSGNTDIEAAVNWIVDHENEPSIDPMPLIAVNIDIDSPQPIQTTEEMQIKAQELRAYQVLDHIIPSSAAEMKQDTSLQDTDPDLWSRVDAIVLQWIYSTISEDLLNTILERDSTAALAWNRLRDIFSDNKNSRALYLEQEFSKVQMEHFTDASSYCQHLKSLSDQLSNVGSPVTNERLVLQLVSGLTDAYASVGSQIRHGDSLPPFYKARSMLVLEETARMKKASQTSSNSAFFVSPVAHSSGHTAGNPFHHRSNHTSNRSSSTRNSRGGGSGARSSKGRGRGGGRGGQLHQQQYTTPWQPMSSQQQQWSFPPWAGPWQPWATPPCPYPTANHLSHQPSSQRQTGLLGPRPQQAHMAASTQQAPSSYAPTDIQAAMHTLSITPPDNQWYMDTGATSHMTANGGITPLFHSPNQPNPFEAQVYPTPLVAPPAQPTPPLQAQQTPLITPILTSPVRDLSPHQSASPNRTLPSPSNSSPRPISPSPTDQPNSHSPPPPMDTTQAIPLDHPPHSPQMTTRSQHGIFKPRKFLNLHTSSDNFISPLPTNPRSCFDYMSTMLAERIRAGKEIHEAKRIAEDNERKRYLALRKAEKEEEKRAREKVRQKLEADKDERRRMLGLPSVSHTATKLSRPSTDDKKNYVSVASVSKVEKLRECLRSLKRSHKVNDFCSLTYTQMDDDARVKRAFQTLLVYVGNVAQNPDKEKFRKIRIGNPLFQNRVGRLIGGIEFLELCGFERIEEDKFLFLPRDKVDLAVLNSAGLEIKSAMSNPFFGLLSRA